MPPFIIQLYQIIKQIQGIIIFLGIPSIAIVMLVRGISTWRNTKDWETVFQALESILKIMILFVIAFSILSAYDWIRATPAGAGLPDISAQVNQANQ